MPVLMRGDSHCSVAESCPSLGDAMGCSPPGSSVRGISQARTLEWAALPPPGGRPDPGSEPRSPALAGGFFTTETPGKPSLCLGNAKLTNDCSYER